MENEINQEENHGGEKKKKINTEMVLFLIVGILLGVVLKTEATKRVITGFDDYKIAALNRSYDLNQLAEDAEKKAREAAENGETASADAIPQGGSCGQ